MESQQSHKASPSRISFLDLPLELRDHIYTSALLVHGAIFMYSPNHWTARLSTVQYKARIVRHKHRGPIEPQHLGPSVALSLLRTCKQVHSESSPIFYGKNIFRIGPLNDLEAALVYRQLVRHVVYMADADFRIYKSNLDEVNYGWTRRLWPSIVSGGTATLERYPNLKTLTVTLTSPTYGHEWRPAFFAVYGKTKEQRIALAVNWLQPRCPLVSERLRGVLKVELHVPFGKMERDEFKGSKFAVEDDGEYYWDCEEFAEAFGVMKGSG
ncbi:hypothetical protein ACEQ8H_002088 [Pleosporales sp. CAS-2024a]